MFHYGPVLSLVLSISGDTYYPLFSTTKKTYSTLLSDTQQRNTVLNLNLSKNKVKESTIILLVVENYFVVYLFMTKSFVMVKFLFFLKKRKKEETFTRLN